MAQKKILWLIPDSKSEVFEFYRQALSSQGHQVTAFHFRDEVNQGGVRRMRQEVLKRVIEPGRFDWVFASFFPDSCEISPEFLLDIKKKAPLIIWSFDDEMYLTLHTIYLAQVVDFVVTTDFLGRGVIEQIGVPTAYLPYPGLDTTTFPAESRKAIDVSFVGNCHSADRKDYLRFLKDNGVPVTTYGRGSENGFTSRKTYFEIMRTTKVCLNFSKLDLPASVLRSEPWRRRVRQVKGRPFEIAAFGGLCLTEYSPSIEHVFRVGEEIDVFRNKEELLQKVKFYLQNDEEREKMARRAQARVREDWSTARIVGETLNSVEVALARKNQTQNEDVPIVKSVAFRTSEVKYGNFLAASLIKRGKILLAWECLVDIFLRGGKGTFRGLCAGIWLVLCHVTKAKKGLGK